MRVIDGDGKFERAAPEEVVNLPFSIHEDYQWTVSKERERFLILVDIAGFEAATNEDGVATAEPNHLKLVTNWFTELNELVPLDGK